MLIRLIMTVFLLAAMMMPAWAGEKESAPIESSSATSAEQMTMEEALSKVTIKAEDRLDGDMYHIRYTFTNPTDVAIEKDILYTEIALIGYWKDSYSVVTKADNSQNRHLRIAPHGETTMLFSFPKEYTHEQYSFRGVYFFFSRDKFLAYDTYPITPEIPKETKGDLSFEVEVIPPDTPNGLSQIALTIDNQTPQHFHEMKNLSISGSCDVLSIDRNASFNFIRTAPIEVNISPYSQKTLTFSAYAKFLPSSLSFGPKFYEVSATLDNKRYYKPIDKHTEELEYRTIYHTDALPQNTKKSIWSDASYYIKDGIVHCLFKVQNQYDRPCKLTNVTVLWHFLTPFSTVRYVAQSFYYREGIRLAENESQYYTTSFYLPFNYYEPYDRGLAKIFCEIETAQGNFYQHLLLNEREVSPLCQILYQPLPVGDDF